MKTKSCEYCCSVFEVSSNVQRFCSKECADKAWEEKDKEHLRSVCENCKKVFYAKRKSKSKFCSQECSQEYRRKLVEQRKVAEAVVKAQKKIEREVEKEKAKAELQKRKNKKALEQYKKQRSENRDCNFCGAIFYPEYGDKGKFCSDECREQARLVAQRKSSKGGGLNERARRTLRKIYGDYWQDAYEPIKPIVVFTRDGWICGICGEPIDPSLAFPDVNCASVDHIIPLYYGGGNLYSNVQASHFICNTRKRTEIVLELD